MKKRSLHVWVSKYQNADIQALRYAFDDALAFQNRLERSGEYDRTVMAKPEEQNRDAILALIQELTRDLGPGDVFVFTYSGHGVEDEGDVLMMFPKVDPRRERLLRGGHVLGLNEVLDEVRGAFDVLIVMNCCRSPLLRGEKGDADAGFMGRDAIEDTMERALERPGSVRPERMGAVGILFACDSGETAWELEPLKKGLFHAALLRWLDQRRDAAGPVVFSNEATAQLGEMMCLLAAQSDKTYTSAPWLKVRGALPPLLGEREVSVAAVPEGRYWVALEGREPAGPYRREQVVAMAEEGVISPETCLRLDGETVWVRATRFPWLAFVHEPKAMAPPPLRPRYYLDRGGQADGPHERGVLQTMADVGPYAGGEASKAWGPTGAAAA